MSNVHDHRYKLCTQFNILAGVCIILAALFFYSGVGLEAAAAQITVGDMSLSTGTVGGGFLAFGAVFGWLSYRTRPLVSKTTTTETKESPVGGGTGQVASRKVEESLGFQIKKPK
jgi:hypothetical protein